MNDSPLVSVLIPAYNHERFIGDCIHSVMAQDWPRMELIAVDDGSPDGTWRELQALAEEARKSGKFERVEIATQENRGTCETLNRLCSMARGDFIAMIASDDMYLPGAFSALMKPLMEDESIGVVVGQNELMDGDGRRCFWDAARNNVYDEKDAVDTTFNQFIERTTGVIENSEAFGCYESLLKVNHIVNGQLIRRSFLERILPFQKDAPLEDWWMHLQLSKLCKYRAIPAHTFRYRWHAANTIKQTEKMLSFGARTLKWEYDHVLKMGNPRWIEAVRRATCADKTVFSLFGLLSLRRVRTPEASRRFLCVGTWRFMYRERRFF